MKLEIVITHWTEDWSIGENAFLMLRLQRCVDWNDIQVTIIHDGSKAFPSWFFTGYPFSIRQVELPHGGIAAARNWAINHSEAEWIKFNDFDDMFAGVYSVRNIMNALSHADDFDLLWFPVYGEQDGQLFLKTDRDPVVIHGKVFRRTFLNRKGLRFPEHLTWCEDSAFLAVLEMEIDHNRIGKITTEAPIYAWIARQGSLCNRPEIKFQNRQSFFERHKYVAEEFLKHGHQTEHDMMIVRTMGDAYHTLRKEGIKEDMTAFEREVWNYYREHEQEFNNVSEADFDRVLAAVNRENKPEFTKAEFLEWIKQKG